MDPWESSLRELEERLARQGARQRELAPRTRAAYLGDCRRVARWLADHGVPSPDRVSPSALDACFRELSWSAATRRRATIAVREWLARYYPPNRSPADLVDVPKLAERPVPRLSQVEAAGVIDGAADPADSDPGSVRRALALRNRALLEVLYGSGLRRQEACDLVLTGVDFEHETIRVVGKGGKARTVPLTEPAGDALRAWLCDGRPRLVRGGPIASSRAPVFVSRSGAALDGSAVYRVVAGELRRAGRAGGPHLLRHATATHLLEGGDGRDGAHLRVVQEILGHGSLATTQRYTGVTTKAMQRALRRGHPRG
jgi:site-specific recombinase XerD